MSDVTFPKKGFVWTVLIVIVVTAGMCALLYYTGYYDGENNGYEQGLQAGKGVLRAPRVGQIYEGVVVGKEFTKGDYYELSGGEPGKKYLYKKDGFVSIEIF